MHALRVELPSDEVQFWGVVIGVMSTKRKRLMNTISKKNLIKTHNQNSNFKLLFYFRGRNASMNIAIVGNIEMMYLPLSLAVAIKNPNNIATQSKSRMSIFFIF